MVARPIRLENVQAITFDCYGTLIDWEGGAVATLRSLLEKGGAAPELLHPSSLASLFVAWERAQRFRIEKSYAPYREIATETLRQVASDRNLPLTADDARSFATSIATWNPFPDVRDALTGLQRYVKLGIISNIDDDILAASVKKLGVQFDLLMTAEQARAYKPSPVPFRRALDRLALPANRVAHAAFGFEYDIVTANTLGFLTVLVRRGRTEFPPTPVPDLAVADIAELGAAFD